MYTRLNTLNRVLKNADQFVLRNDRDLYSVYLKAVEEYIAEHGFYLGGDAGNELLIGDNSPEFAYSREVVNYEIHCTDPGRHMQNLSDRLYTIDSRTTPKWSIVGETIAKSRDYKITINTRDLIMIHSFPLAHSMEDVVISIPPVIRRGPYSGLDIRCIPGIPHLISIYRRLYSPYSPEFKHSYTHYIENSKTLWKHVDKDLLAVANSLKSGGMEDESDDESIPELVGDYDGGCCGNMDNVDIINRDDVIEKDDIDAIGGAMMVMADHGHQKELPDQRIIVSYLRRKLPHARNVILIGDYAIDMLPDISYDKPAKYRLQLISENITGIIDAFRDINPSVDYKYNRFPSLETSDFQTVKYTVYFETPNGRKITLCDVYNNTSFELVPFKEYSGVKVGGIFVLCRFKLFDTWTLMMLRDTSLSGRILDNIRQIRLLVARMYQQIDDDPLEVFQLADYLGVYIDRSVELKKILGKSRFSIPKYYPGLNLLDAEVQTETTSDDTIDPHEGQKNPDIDTIGGTKNRMSLLLERPTVSSLYSSSMRSPHISIVSPVKWLTPFREGEFIAKPISVPQRSLPFSLPKVDHCISDSPIKGTPDKIRDRDRNRIYASRHIIASLLTAKSGFACNISTQVDSGKTAKILHDAEGTDDDCMASTIMKTLGINTDRIHVIMRIGSTEVVTIGNESRIDIHMHDDPVGMWVEAILGGATMVIVATITGSRQVIGMETFKTGDLPKRFRDVTPSYILHQLSALLKWISDVPITDGTITIKPMAKGRKIIINET